MMATPQPPHRGLRLPALDIPGNLFLAPMAGYTDRAFRWICLEHGADFTYTEMVCAEALARGSVKTAGLLERAPIEKLLGVQLFAASPGTAAAAVPGLAQVSPSLLDLNCGCSVPKILRSGCGARLLREPRVIGEIVRALVDASGLPVSVKLRSGWDAEEITYLAAAREAVRAGAAMVVLHPRTRSQGFGGTARWEHIAKLKQEVGVPVIGSGDLFTAEDGVRMMASTGCDGVMFARGAVGNPFIFGRTRLILAGRPAPLPSPSRRLETAMLQLRRTAQSKGEERACREMRKHIAAYVKGIPGASEVRRRTATASTIREYELILCQCRDLPKDASGRGCVPSEPSV